MNFLQHVLHAMLYHRAFEAPVLCENIRVYAARRDLPQEEAQADGSAGKQDGSSLAALYDGLARQHGAELFERRVEKGRVAASYYHFAVQMVKQPSPDAVAADGAGAAAAPAPPAVAAPIAVAHVASSRKRASSRPQQHYQEASTAASPPKEPQRGRKRKAAPAAAAAADADDAELIDLTVAAPAVASAPSKKQQRPRASKEVLRRVVQRKRLIVE
jgi:hypothetical protein